ncbi:MAG: inositol monophosphatase, partial [Acidobacteria bacterium]|nr:inositol monophosphatase [Acidobacteriota bacterium]
NFAHGYPAFNVTIGLERAGEMIAGVIFDPIRQEMFAAELGGGAFLNGRRIHVSKSPRLDTALLATGFPSRKRHENVNVHFFHQVSMVSHGIRRSGSAAIDLAYVACGRLEGFWEFGLNPWDMAAGLLLVREAGGRTTDMRGGAAELRGPHIAVTNGLIHNELLELFGEVFEGRYRYPMPPVTGAR